ncbi:MAG: hypothetical protein JWN55_402 [Frankiales bacterium]|nr:hypothetical protein [Frankiales bacterium]
MNPLGSRSRVEELARLLDGAVSGPGALTAGHAALATRLRAVAPALNAVAAPRPEFRSQLRQRLVAVATVQAAADAPYATPLTRHNPLQAAASWSHTHRAQRRIGVTAGVMAGVIAFTGVAVAASRSLPGAPFYGLKRAAEGVQLQFAAGDTARGTKHLQFAETRLREVRALAHGDQELALGGAMTPVAASSTAPVAAPQALGGSLQDRLEATLRDFNSETKIGTALLQSVFRETGKPEPLRILKTFSAQQRSRLTALLPTLPATVRGDAQDSLDLVTNVGTDASQLLALGTCGAQCYPQPAPSVTSEPAPKPGVTAAPSPSAADNNGVPPCVCTQPTATPEPTPATQPTATAEPTSEPTPTATPSDTPSPSPEPTPTSSPSAPPMPLPTAIMTLLPSLPPLPLPLLPSLPALPPLASLLPSLVPLPRG